MRLLVAIFLWVPLQANIYYSPLDSRHIIIDTRIDSRVDLLVKYQDLVTALPHYLEWIIKDHLSFSLIIPGSIEGVGPLEEKAPFIEGARTALAWIQVYKKAFLENQLDYEIITEFPLNLASKDFQQISLALPEPPQTIFQLPWEDDEKKTVFLSRVARDL